MFHTISFITRLGLACAGISSRSPSRPRQDREQRGAAILAFALAGLTGMTVLAMPVLARSVNDLHVEQSTAARVASGASSAAEHALWRIGNDPDFLASMSGVPPEAEYTLGLPGGDATVTVTSVATQFNPKPVTVALTVDPSVIDPDTPTTVTFTLSVTNNDVVPHNITRADANPIFWGPDYVVDSTTGMTDQDPIGGFFGYRWDINPGAAIPAFGGSASLEWEMVVDQGWGTWWTSASVRVEGYGNVYAPLSARVRFMALDDADITTVVSPVEVTAGPENTFDYTITLLNTGVDPLTVEWIKHYTTTDFDYVGGTSSGITATDPSVYYDWLSGRRVHEWTLPDVALEPFTPLTLSFQLDASLTPGVHYTRSAFKVAEDGGSFGFLSTLDTGETAPITAIHAYQINASRGDETVDIEATVGSGGVDILTWEQS